MTFTSFGPFAFAEGCNISGWHTALSAGVQAVYGELNLESGLQQQELAEKIPGLVVYLPISGIQNVRAKSANETYRIEPGRAYFASADAGAYIAEMEQAGCYTAVKLFLDQQSVASLSTSAAAIYRTNPSQPIYSEVALKAEWLSLLSELPSLAPQSLPQQLEVQSRLSAILASVLTQWEQVEAGEITIDSQRFDAQIIAADAYLRRHLEHPPSVTALANLVGLNHMTMKRGFRRKFNMTVYGRLRHWRIDAAITRLHEGCSVTQAAIEVGYSNPSKFAAAFKKVTGKSPSEHRRTKA
ncbi:MAG: AraC family transcriptional regulator [Pseudomonadota bacterium]